MDLLLKAFTTSLESDSTQMLLHLNFAVVSIVKVKLVSSASKANLIPIYDEKNPLTKPRQVRKTPQQPACPGELLAAPSILTLIQIGCAQVYH